MGLDMYAYAVPEKLAKGDFKFERRDDEVTAPAYIEGIQTAVEAITNNLL